MAVSTDDELAKLRAQRMAEIQSQLEEQAAAQAEKEASEGRDEKREGGLTQAWLAKNQKTHMGKIR